MNFQRRLASSPVFFNAYCIVAAFSTYFCMYAFRKPFAVGRYEGSVDLGFLPPIDYKVLFIIFQVFGYMLSKFVGIKVVSELPARRRAFAILAMIGAAELALLGFGLVPAPYNVLFLFLNGIPLGMVWGLVFGFLEGRQTTELLGAGLCASFILASGVVKSVGRAVMTWGVSEYWMPFVTGLLFAPILVFSVWMLAKIPKPTAADEKLRTKRAPMNAHQRRTFFAKNALGLTLLVSVYTVLTAYRDFRDNYAREIWDKLGFGNQPHIFTATEIPITALVLAAMALLMFVKNNRRALEWIHYLMLFGAGMIGFATLGFQAGVVSPTVWMVLVGLGLYFGYVPFNCILFDRLIAAVGSIATAGFLIYVADAFGYLGSVTLLLYKNFGHPNLSWLDFFTKFSYATSLACSAGILISMAYFHRKKQLRK